MAIRENGEISLKSKQRKKCKINAWCLNKDYNPPKPKEDYVWGNITIFEVENKAFKTNNDLWVNMQRCFVYHSKGIGVWFVGRTDYDYAFYGKEKIAEAVKQAP